MELSEWEKSNEKNAFGDETNRIVYSYESKCVCIRNEIKDEGYLAQTRVYHHSKSIYFDIYKKGASDEMERVFFGKVNDKETRCLYIKFTYPKGSPSIADESFSFNTNDEGRIYVEGENTYLWKHIVENRHISCGTILTLCVSANDYTNKAHYKYVFDVKTN